jgi:hypothetical protein
MAWYCVKCAARLGPIDDRCAGCGEPPTPGEVQHPIGEKLERLPHEDLIAVIEDAAQRAANETRARLFAMLDGRA